ncbi:hypothetical protein CAPTEDRAFT_209521 [Capitella teleta]|uniref:NACHT domain-containing protein n=1 Tax=Capitella teleta TaxID=283909 RepID=R7TNL9_CAPTE|nr:hypothetical protein CAPTEDRAFT_209521 [Capitella teleta]|eukprot:ELT92665.1 hypothetical protein CAPTEDRAFT_209521 [Capitella teleta]
MLMTPSRLLMLLLLTILIMDSALGLCTWNSRGHGADRLIYINKLLQQCDILLVQETWLHDWELNKLSDDDAISILGVSGMDPQQHCLTSRRRHSTSLSRRSWNSSSILKRENRVSWHRASSRDILAYKEMLSVCLEVDKYYDDIVRAMRSSAEVTIPVCKKRGKAGWSTHFKQFQEDAIFWNRIWVEDGRPTTGSLSIIRRSTRAQYRRASKWVVRNQDKLSADRMAQALASNNSRDLWGEVKKKANKVRDKPIIVDDADGELEVCEMFKVKYESLYGSVSFNENDMNEFIDQVTDRISTTILRSQGKMVLLSEQRKQILIDKRDDLAETIKMQAKLWSLMRSHNIVNKQDEDLIKLNRTPYEQVGALLDHLAKRTDRDYGAFCECLEADDQPHVVSEILCHRVPSSSNEDVCQQLRNLYCRFEDIATGPEWAPEFALDSAKFYISLHLQKGETATTEKKEFTQDEVFVSHRDEGSSSAKKPCNPKRILVEGDPGMGKTTLCQDLAFRWARQECTGECKCAPCVHSWYIVIYLTAANLQGYQDIHSAVKDHLLPDCDIDQVKKALNFCEDKTLFIIDSFDEGHKDNVLLHDLIKGKVYANTTLLLTSRPNYLQDFLKKHFHSKLSTDGFNREQKPKHLVQTPNDLKDWLETITEFEWKDEHDSLKEFLFDLMHGDSLLETSLVIMERFIYSHERIHNFPHSCLLLRLLRHLKEKTIILSPEMEAEFKKSCLSIINRTVTRAMFHSITITFATISHNIKPQDISMITDTEAKQFVDYLRSLDEHAHVDLIIECADESVAFPDAMQGGLQDSFFSYAADQLSSNIPLVSCKEDPNDFLRIALEQSLGNDIREMKIKGYGGDASKSFLKAALNKPLEMLKIGSYDMEWNEKTIDASCGDMLAELLLNPQLKILHIIDAFNNSIPRMQLLSQLSRLDAPGELYLQINMENTSSEEVQFYEQILKKNKMQKLTIYGDGLSDELRSVLQCTIPTMTALKALSFMFGPFDFWSSADDHLQLQSLYLDHVSFNSESFDNLCGIIAKWTNLRTMDINAIWFEPQQTVQFGTLFTAIAKCQMLSQLSMYELGIGDDVMDQLCEMMKSLEQLDLLDLKWGNNISPTGGKQIKELAKRRKRRMVVFC